MIKVEGYQNLYRDEFSGAIINCDSIAYDQYVNSVAQRDVQKKEINQMKKDISEIKELLREFLNGSK
jgi:hypothetical protein